jgi:hypothetical protein
MDHISFATLSDIPRLMEIAATYADQYGEFYDLLTLERHFEGVIRDPSSIILTSLASGTKYIEGISSPTITGFIALTLLQSPICQEKLALKIHWIIDKNYPSRGIDLLRSAERWAKLHKAARIIISVRERETEIIMKRFKYSQNSITFEKDL